MNKTVSLQRLSLLGAALISFALLGGCATTTEVQKAQTTADHAMQKADQANTAASAAKTAADQASRKADQANSTVQDAKATADSAKAEADKAMNEAHVLEEKIDRMFKKAMQK